MNVFASAKPFLIAGPCGAEDEQQLHTLASAFKNMPVNMMRAGVWKPRSKPGQFEGRGEVALTWLKDIRTSFGIPICTEVANREQVELALKYGIDALWIGARSTVNPFVVQEIADALRGVQVAVMIKNPVNPDVELWAGAIERIGNAGISSMAAIHRGFSSYDASSKYRNKPNWAIPIEIKRRYKDVPVFCDPSHICGNRTLIQQVSQRALDLDFDGLMIECHPDPDQALSDAAQQITPEQLQALLNQLIIRNPISHSSQEEIDQIRQILDSMDAEVVDLIGKRMELARQLGKIKGELNMPVYQADRWREIVESRTRWGLANGLDNDFIMRLFTLIHDKSIKTQIDVLQELAMMAKK